MTTSREDLARIILGQDEAHEAILIQPTKYNGDVGRKHTSIQILCHTRQIDNIRDLHEAIPVVILVRMRAAPEVTNA
jgi:hypothetical protein